MYCDCHLHILPGFSDGPADLYGAINLLSAIRETDITSAVVTPIFDANTDTVSAFLAKRKRIYDEFIRAAGADIKNFDFILSAEVPLTKNISKTKNLSKLCIGKSNYLPITLPISGLSRTETAELSEMIHKKHIYPMICHTERYCFFYPKRDIEKLFSIPHAVYHFGTKALYDKEIFEIFTRLMREHQNVILGTNSCNYRSYISSCSIPKMIFEGCTGLAPYNVLALKNKHFVKLCVEGKQKYFN